MATGYDILVVDDDCAVREVVAEVLEEEGYRVMTAANGAEALALIENDHPQLVLLDMQMPVLDGRGFARAVRERGLRLAILVMSAAREAGRWAQEIGARGFLRKPFEMGELLSAVETCCAS